MHRRVKLYVWAITALAVLALALVRIIGFPADSESLRGAIAFTGLGLVAQVTAYSLAVGTGGSTSSLPFLTAALLSPSLLTALLVTGAMGIAEAIRRTTSVKRLFNVAQLCLSFCLALIAYVLLGGGPLRAASIDNLVAYVALVVAFQVVNTLAVAGVVAMSTRSRLIPVWRRNAAAVLGYDLVSIPVAYCFGVVYLKLGIAGVILLGLLVFGARQLYSTNRQLDQANRELLEVIVAAIELRDPYTSGHSQRVAQYSVTIARAIGLSRNQVGRVGVAALLHDVGKIDQRFATILQKPGRLTEEERRVIELHPVVSEELVSRVSGLADILPAIRHHHERWDGMGYPDRLERDAIPLFARIISFADTIDAMLTDRPYRPALSSAEVRAELLRNRGKQFDPALCDQLLASPSFQHLFGSNTGNDTCPERLAPAPVLAA